MPSAPQIYVNNSISPAVLRWITWITGTGGYRKCKPIVLTIFMFFGGYCSMVVVWAPISKFIYFFCHSARIKRLVSCVEIGRCTRRYGISSIVLVVPADMMTHSSNSSLGQVPANRRPHEKCAPTTDYYRLSDLPWWQQEVTSGYNCHAPCSPLSNLIVFNATASPLGRMAPHLSNIHNIPIPSRPLKVSTTHMAFAHPMYVGFQMLILHRSNEASGMR